MSVGLELDPWQQLVLRHALGEREDGRWSAFEVGLTVPRQNGKSALIEARMLAGVMLFDEEVVVYSAHEFRTVTTLMRRVERLLKNSGEPYRPKRSHGEEGFVLGRDVNDPEAPRMMFSSRTKVSGRGLTGDTVILDEAMIIKPEAIGALMPTLSSRPNPQLWYAGSAVDEDIHPHGIVFGGVRKRAMDRTSPRLCYLEWGCEDGANPTSERERARSNPSYGIRISAEYIEDEYHALIHTPAIFAVERLGIGKWPVLDAGAQRLIPAAKWNDMRSPNPELIGSPSLGIDRSPDGKQWTIAAAQRTADGRIHLEIGPYEFGSNLDVVEKVAEMVSAWDPSAVVVDARSSAAALKNHLIAAGVEPVMTGTAEFVLACGGFLDDALSGHLSHSGQRELGDAVMSASKRDLAGGFAWDRPEKGSITPLVAATLAHWGLMSFGGKPTKLPGAPLLAETPLDRSQDREFDPLTAAF